jgi:hypothetical protein
MRIFEHSHASIVDQITGAVVRSATSHSVGALMRGHSVGVVIVIAAVLIFCAWGVKRIFF